MNDQKCLAIPESKAPPSVRSTHSWYPQTTSYIKREVKNKKLVNTNHVTFLKTTQGGTERPKVHTIGEAVSAFRSLAESAKNVQRTLHPMEGFILTAYSLSEQSTGKKPNTPGFGVTYSGTHATVGRTVAVDPKIIPIGTPLYIDGIGWRLAEDVGGAVRGKHIDVLMDSDNACFHFGVKRHVRVYPLLGE